MKDMSNSDDVKPVRIKKSKLIKIVQEADSFIEYLQKFLPNHLKKVSSNEEKIKDKNGYKEVNGTMLANKKSRAKTIEELHQRLAALKGKKTGTYKEKLTKKGIKNRLKKKQKLEERKVKSGHKKSRGNKPSFVATAVGEPTARNTKPVFNSEGNVVYSKFDFAEEPCKETKKKIDKDPKKALKKIESNKIKLESLEKSGQTQKVLHIKNKQMWDSAIQKAEGVKIKDNPELLKKSIRRKQQQKNKSKKKWEAREEQVKKKKEEAQKKRQENIGKKNKLKKQKKINKAVKKGRMVL